MSNAIQIPRFVLRCAGEAKYAHAVEVEAKLTLLKPGICRLQYRVDGDMPRLCVPDLEEAVRQDGLWQHTCFEFFVARPDNSYLEFNFSPSKKWAAYQFESYREGMSKPDLASSPKIAVQITENSLELDAVINLQDLLIEDSVSQCHIALAAVIESSSGNLSYWALNHPLDRPDFHHPDSFVSALSDNGD